MLQNTNKTEKNEKKLSDAEVQSLWFEFDKDRDSKVLRDKLIVQYMYLIKYVVGRLRNNLPGTISTDDISGYGVEGLINAGFPTK